MNKAPSGAGGASWRVFTAPSAAVAGLGWSRYGLTRQGTALGRKNRLGPSEKRPGDRHRALSTSPAREGAPTRPVTARTEHLAGRETDCNKREESEHRQRSGVAGLQIHVLRM